MATMNRQQTTTPTWTGGWGSSSLARTLARRSPFAGRQLPGGTVLPSGQQQPTNAAPTTTSNTGAAGEPLISSDGKRQTLFGPQIGGEDDDEVEQEVAAAMRAADAGQTPRETVSVETVKGWIERSKSSENPHPTTTLQSLVNLKRPTLALVPLPSTVPDSSPHTLKFTYDSSAPAVQVSVRLHLPQPTETDPLATVSELVWAGQVPGGFGKQFVLPEQGTLDFGFAAHAASTNGANATDGEERESLDLEKKRSSNEATSESSATTAAADAGTTGTTPVLDSRPTTNSFHSTSGSSVPSGGAQSHHHAPARTRLGRFLRRHDNSPSSRDLEAQVGGGVAGDNVATTEVNAANNKESKKSIRVVIRLEARGPQGEALASLNAQQTHLEISNTTRPAPAVTSSGSGDIADASAPADDEHSHSSEDNSAVGGGTVVVDGQRSTWAAKVIRREALIGTHVFHLREIFGLTSAATAAAASATPASATYPPQPEDDPYASTPNECIVCLVSPRDVVLLPCRHLVVCKECAVGMVEFGAGGKVSRREDGADLNTSEANTGGEGGAEAGVVPVPAPAAPAATTGRTRKKKAKGWFCPVCRQPYTSMLRIALPTTKPGVLSHDDDHLDHALTTLSLSDDKASQPEHIHEAHEVPARPASPTPTLPGRAESVLYPDDVEQEQELEQEREQERPQFVLGPEETEEADEERRRRVEASV